jgi:glycine betaine/proline transport system substrate-binding protein
MKGEREVRMSKRSVWLAVLCGVAVSATLLVGGSALAGRTATCGTVTLNEQAWAGSTANTYVAKYVLEKRLGCKVRVTKITEIPSFQAMADGKTDAVLEDWQHVDQYKQYVTKQKTVVLVGSNGLTGHIGWFIPRFLLKQYPQFRTWRGLKGKESVFKSPESGSQGMFLGGDPSYVQKDKELIKALGLNFKHVTVGAEPAEVARFTQLIKQKKPVIFYWWTPQYLNAQLDLAEVLLPPVYKGCKEDASAGGDANQYKCAYSSYPLNKLFSAKFVRSGSPAVAFLRKWKWSNNDQNLVAKWIAGDHMKPDAAAEKWVKANPGKVKAWLG